MPTPRVISSRARELSIICEDRPGTLSHLAKVLGDAKVNIVAMSCTPAGVQGAVRVIVDDFPRAKSALDREHLSYAEHDVLYVEIPNMPGALAEFTGKLAAENINISIAYGAAAKGTRNAIVVFRVSDLEKAASIR
ncbi:MAG: ACT domain-containing protein [Acidobacteriia bacterium]|nr:ACT domain-containing protein [Terriglobia bacterium]